MLSEVAWNSLQYSSLSPRAEKRESRDGKGSARMREGKRETERERQRETEKPQGRKESVVFLMS